MLDIQHDQSQVSRPHQAAAAGIQSLPLQAPHHGMVVFGDVSAVGKFFSRTSKITSLFVQVMRANDVKVSCFITALTHRSEFCEPKITDKNLTDCC